MSRRKASSGGSGRLASILLGVLGGDYGVNPDYAKTAEMAKIGASPKENRYVDPQPIKANNMFARPQANALNSQYNLNELARGNQSAGEIRAYEQMTPLVLKRLMESGKLNNEQTIELKKIVDDLDINKLKREQTEIGPLINKNSQESGRNAANTAMLTGRNLLANAPTEEQYGGTVNPELLAAYGKEASNRVRAQDIEAGKLGIESAVQGVSEPFLKSTGEELARFNYEKTKGLRKNLPAILAMEPSGMEADLALKQKALSEPKIFPVSQGSGLFNADTGKLMYQNDPMAGVRALADKATGITTGNNVSTVPTPPTNDPNDSRNWKWLDRINGIMINIVTGEKKTVGQ